MRQGWKEDNYWWVRNQYGLWRKVDYHPTHPFLFDFWKKEYWDKKLTKLKMDPNSTGPFSLYYAIEELHDEFAYLKRPPDWVQENTSIQTIYADRFTAIMEEDYSETEIK